VAVGKQGVVGNRRGGHQQAPIIGRRRSLMRTRSRVATWCRLMKSTVTLLAPCRHGKGPGQVPGSARPLTTTVLAPHRACTTRAAATADQDTGQGVCRRSETGRGERALDVRCRGESLLFPRNLPKRLPVRLPVKLPVKLPGLAPHAALHS
jgi:hypothetical protein